jgi:uncharacterized membrane protein YkvA (DUF1232 family)
MLALLVRLKSLWMARRYLARVVRLFLDNRVSLGLKVTTLAAAIVILSPFDLLGDIPVVGVVDDVALLSLLAMLFVRLCPSDVRADYFGETRRRSLKNVTP